MQKIVSANAQRILGIIFVCLAYTYKLYTYTERTRTILTRMFSICIQFVWVCSAYVYYLYDFDAFFRKRMLSIRIQFVSVCSVYVYKLYVYAQHTSILEKIDYQGEKKSLIKFFCTWNILPIQHWIMVKKLGSKISCLGTFKWAVKISLGEFRAPTGSTEELSSADLVNRRSF